MNSESCRARPSKYRADVVDALAGTGAAACATRTPDQIDEFENGGGSSCVRDRGARRHHAYDARHPRIGHLHLGEGFHVIGVGVPFGRLEAQQLRGSPVIAAAGGSEVRLSPWRVLYAGVRDAVGAETALAGAADAGAITTATDPLLQVEACPGAPDCPSASLDTRLIGRLMAGQIPRSGFSGTIHVSGCWKGCARSAPAKLTLVASDARYLVVPTALPTAILSAACRRMSCGQHRWRCWIWPRNPRMSEPYPYIRDGAEIYRNSFAIIRAEADLERFKGHAQKVAVRIIHACGMIEIARDIHVSETFVDVARAALLKGAPILCDAKMVAQGITRARLPASNEVVCTLDDPSVAGLARDLGNTRSAAAMELWRPHLDGAVVAIGNAPTSLFRLLEMIDAGAPLPAAVIGVPVGFVGAAESKEALAAHPLAASGRLPYLIVRGRKGGSAMAVAAVNALASEGGMTVLDALAGEARGATLYGIGVGPGDVRYMTLRAAGLVRTVDVVSYFAKRGFTGNARSIVEPLIGNGRAELRLEYPVTRRFLRIIPNTRRRSGLLWPGSGRDRGAVEAGKSVGLLAEGDPFFYGSFMHMWRRLEAEFPVEVVPGVTACPGAGRERMRRSRGATTS